MLAARLGSSALRRTSAARGIHATASAGMYFKRMELEVWFDKWQYVARVLRLFRLSVPPVFFLLACYVFLGEHVFGLAYPTRTYPTRTYPTRGLPDAHSVSTPAWRRSHRSTWRTRSTSQRMAKRRSTPCRWRLRESP